jgi:hypothetical protein
MNIFFSYGFGGARRVAHRHRLVPDQLVQGLAFGRSRQNLGLGCGNREVHIIGVAEANLADLFLGRGIEQRRSLVAMRRDESPVDVERVDGAWQNSLHFGERYAP